MVCGANRGPCEQPIRLVAPKRRSVPYSRTLNAGLFAAIACLAALAKVRLRHHSRASQLKVRHAHSEDRHRVRVLTFDRRLPQLLCTQVNASHHCETSHTKTLRKAQKGNPLGHSRSLPQLHMLMHDTVTHEPGAPISPTVSL